MQDALDPHLTRSWQSITQGVLTAQLSAKSELREVLRLEIRVESSKQFVRWLDSEWKHNGKSQQ